MKKLLLVLAMFAVTSTQAALIELATTQDFEDLIATSETPVMVSFSAAWCGPCQQLKGVLKKVAVGYTDAQVKIAYVDADVNKALKKYLMGGYPTVRTFEGGNLATANFVGSKSETFVRAFVDDLIESRAEADVCPL